MCVARSSRKRRSHWTVAQVGTEVKPACPTRNDIPPTPLTIWGSRHNRVRQSSGWHRCQASAALFDVVGFRCQPGPRADDRGTRLGEVSDYELVRESAQRVDHGGVTIPRMDCGLESNHQ